MKKAFFLLLVFISCECFAIDVIVTTSQEKIEGKILEVSSSEIKYKKASNPNGPTFVIEKEKVSTIVYENGEVEVLKHEEIKPVTTEDKKVEAAGNAKAEQKGKEITGNVGKLYRSRILLPNGKKRYRVHTKDNSVIMTDKEFESYLAENCPAAYKYNRKAHVTATISIVTAFFCTPAAFTLCIVSGVQSSKVLPTYNEKCAE
ncbi:MAG: hypothetical protein J6S89_11485 [Paludibacteraceae bacterium]|nr:hypothetical protein [Paludibacteraceae bacterium]MBO7637185.1 hypothetical protein [Paludibacteraceae bacterium]